MTRKGTLAGIYTRLGNPDKNTGLWEITFTPIDGNKQLIMDTNDKGINIINIDSTGDCGNADNAGTSGDSGNAKPRKKKYWLM